VFWAGECPKLALMKVLTVLVTAITLRGACTHWKTPICKANFSWANDYAEGFISGVVTSVEVFYKLRCPDLALSR